MQVKDSVAVIVGGASGMARATAFDLAERGAKIAIFDLPLSEGAKVAEQIGNGTLFAPLDVTDHALVPSRSDSCQSGGRRSRSIRRPICRSRDGRA